MLLFIGSFFAPKPEPEEARRMRLRLAAQCRKQELIATIRKTRNKGKKDALKFQLSKLLRKE